mmetsp:Transcript_20956/g.39389  ORF Transcript_20956/g.39389 Transcript_20956/m.39389 type:complete len:285 (-) Transcript_20956:159-1013(-)
MMSRPSLDWPLSKEEQKKRIMRLYDKDVQAANELLHSGEEALKVALQALHKKLKETSSTDTRSKGSQETDDGAHVGTGSAVSSHQRQSSHEKFVSDEVHEPEVVSEGGETAAEAATRLQGAIVDAAAALASLFGTSSLSSVLVGIAADADKEEGSEQSIEVRQRAKSEGAPRVLAPALHKPEDRRRRKSRGGEPLQVSFADPEEIDASWPGRTSNRRRPSIAEPEPSPPTSPRLKQPQAAPKAQFSAVCQPVQSQSRVCVPRRQRRGRAPPEPASAPSGMLDFI